MTVSSKAEHLQILGPSRAHQRNRINRRSLHLHLYVIIWTYYMYHVSLYLSRDLYVCIKRSIIGNWLTRLWSTTGSKICRVTQQTDDSQWDSYNPWAWEPGEPEVGSNLKAGKSHCPSLKAFRQGEFFLTWGGSAFLFYSGLQLTVWVSFPLWRAICITQFTNLNVNLTKNTLIEIPRIIFDIYKNSGCLWLSKVDT